jgi:YcxB-like protein
MKAPEARIEIDVLLELRDYLRANYWFLFRKFKLLIFLLLFIGGIYPILYFSGLLLKSSETDNPSIWGFLIPWAIFLFLLAGTYLGSKKSLASNRALQETIHYTFSLAGIQSDAQSSSGHQSWQNVRQAFETKTNFLLFLADRLMFVIPKRCLRDSAHEEAFRALLNDRLSERAKLSK